ncbi:hypothetical protein EVU96_12805 [Bacillus infantis]|uniref:hypothetical protein n=1 Tax=Bacillus infantis TaxID=324767 RepID=UPI00101D3602|nr:hypothetical protein [Bacillus infantis]RYI28807.1 hypothetical protein EVU96_12805 [Bacillus infantis]
MIYVKPTKQHIQNIKNNKKFLEKWDMWDFAYFDGKEHYFLTAYHSITGAITGYLILNRHGQAVPLAEAKEPAFMLIRYNTLVHNTISELVPRTNPNMKPFEDLAKLLKENKSRLIGIDSKAVVSADRIIQHCETSIQESKEVREIVLTVGGYQREVTREKGYFDEVFYEKMNDEILKYSEMMYKYGLRQRELQGDYEHLSRLLETGQLNERKLKGLLKDVQRSNKDTLEKSMASFERDSEGNRIDINPQNIKAVLQEIKRRDGEKHLAEKSLPLIRNPR